MPRIMFTPEVNIVLHFEGLHPWGSVGFSPQRSIWDYGPVIQPAGGRGAYPGLTHNVALGCATSRKGEARDTISCWATYYLPLYTCSSSFPTTFCFLLAQLAQAWPCPALARFRYVFTGMVEIVSLVQSDLPWPHQLATQSMETTRRLTKAGLWRQRK